MVKQFENYSDSELISLIKKRDRNAFRYLYLNYTPIIKYFVLKNGGQESDAEEIEQNVIIHLFEKIVAGKFLLNENTKLSTYMYAVGKNMWYKMSGRKVFVFPDEIPDINPIEEDFVISFEPQNDIEAIVIEALQNMDDDCKEILTKYYYENKSMKEISNELGTITEDNVRKRKYKCIQKIKKVIEEKNIYNE